MGQGEWRRNLCWQETILRQNLYKTENSSCVRALWPLLRNVIWEVGKHHSRLLSCTSHNRLGSLPTQLEISMIVLINNLPPILPRALSRYTFKASGWCILASLALSARCMAAPELPSPTFSSALRVDSSHPAGYYSSMSLNLITSNKIPISCGQTGQEPTIVGFTMHPNFDWCQSRWTPSWFYALRRRSAWRGGLFAQRSTPLVQPILNGPNNLILTPRQDRD